MIFGMDFHFFEIFLMKRYIFLPRIEHIDSNMRGSAPMHYRGIHMICVSSLTSMLFHEECHFETIVQEMVI